ncbi:fatty acid hydroxylase superfamily-domain-containing protein [Mrakia frigida]|uniref:fatty acid hydroxylase superfamily-domain-containing protein n=1 Tax=Mrakia frigida TaxID=29902 RepID=UPI003FCC0235
MNNMNNILHTILPLPMFLNQTAEATPMYQPSDLVGLNKYEMWWAQFFTYMGDPALATAVLVFLTHEIIYFGRSIPFIIMDFTPYFNKWKIQPNKIPTAAQQWHCAKMVLFSHFFIELPVMGGFHGFTSYFGIQSHQVPFPHWTKMAYQIAIFFVIEDTCHYWFHRALHTPRLYKMIHKVHHEYPAPFGLTAEYAHPLEVLILGAGTIGAPIGWVAYTKDLHLVTVLLWMTLRLMQAVQAHSGYDLPWSLRFIFPFWAGAEHHDYHHKAFTSNFASSFRWWDSIFGTDTAYHAYRRRIDSAKKGKARELAQAEEDRKALIDGAREAQAVIDRAGK